MDKPSTIFALKFVISGLLCSNVLGIKNHEQKDCHDIKLCNEECQTDSNCIDPVGQPNADANGNMTYKNPKEVLGPKFPASAVLDLCAAILLVYADTVAEVKFDAKGTKMCTAVCNQYHRNIVAEGSDEVTPLYGYCDYKGETYRLGVCDDCDMSTQCTCAYRVRCNQHTTMLVYSFQANHKGFIKVSITETNNTRHISR